MAKREIRTTPAQARRDVEAAFNRFNGSVKLQAASEAATRLLLIDEVLKCMGWDPREFSPEASTGTGEFTDYVLTARSEPWLIVEAKRVGIAFDLPPKPPGNTNSSVESLSKLFTRSGSSFKETTKQATRYCNDHAIPLACVTNGWQWVFFRGLSTEKTPWSAGSALAFRSIDEVLRYFDEFWFALAHDSAGTAHLMRTLDRRVEGASVPSDRPIDYLQVYRGTFNADKAAYVRSTANALLGDIYGDGSNELLERCYIEPTSEGEFERSLRRLLEDSTAVIDAESIESGGTQDFVDALHRSHDSTVPSISARQPIVVVGHVGAGKTTFIHRAFAKLRENLDAYFAIVDLEGHASAGSINAREEQLRVCDQILSKLSRAAQTCLKNSGARADAIVRANVDERSTLEQLYSLELRRERGLAGDHSTSIDWKRREYELLSGYRQDTVETLLRYARHLRSHCLVKQRSLPTVIVLDNVDTATDEYQRIMFGLAQQLTRASAALVVLCMREDTYSRGRETGGFLTSTALQFVFHVRSPPFDRLLRARVRFGKYCSSLERGELPPRLRPLLSHSDRLIEMLNTMEALFLGQKSQTLEIVASLAGHNMREAFSLVRWIMTGDIACQRRRNSSADYALECMFAARTFTDLTSSTYLANLYDAEPAQVPTHGLRLRLLSYYWWAYETSHTRSLNERTETVIFRFATLGYRSGEIDRALRELVRQRALIPSDRSEAAVIEATQELPLRMSITASGLVHLRRLHPLGIYRAAMALTTRWYADADVKEFIEQAAEAGGENGISIADVAASPALKTFAAYLERSWANEDLLLAPSVRRQQTWAREVDARCGLQVRRTDSQPAQLLEPKRTRKRTGEQLGIFSTAAHPPPSELRPLPSLFEHEGSKWLPRLLWSLEYAHRMGIGAQTSSQLSRILNDYGELSVYPNNVARAFRDYKAAKQHQNYWRKEGKRYTITEPGRASLEAALAKLAYSGK